MISAIWKWHGVLLSSHQVYAVLLFMFICDSSLRYEWDSCRISCASSSCFFFGISLSPERFMWNANAFLCCAQFWCNAVSAVNVCYVNDVEKSLVDGNINVIMNGMVALSSTTWCVHTTSCHFNSFEIYDWYSLDRVCVFHPILCSFW